jgi:chloride channel 7
MSTLTHLMQHGMYDAFDWDVLLTYFVAYTLGSLLCLGIALPTGMVIPSLIIGASFGRLFGVVVNMVWSAPHAWFGKGPLDRMCNVSWLANQLRLPSRRFVPCTSTSTKCRASAGVG